MCGSQEPRAYQHGYRLSGASTVWQTQQWSEAALDSGHGTVCTHSEVRKAPDSAGHVPWASSVRCLQWDQAFWRDCLKWKATWTRQAWFHVCSGCLCQEETGGPWQVWKAQAHSQGDFVCVFVFYLLLLRQGLLSPSLASNSLCSLKWDLTSDPPSSTSGVVERQVCTPKPRTCSTGDQQRASQMIDK